ncbi:hypothetical protein HMPREF7215_2250 [Pyramidobacter piscolens W5455]|uniref:Uncharacterized protein n=1 Tax=Pyramidobacter piscolens W5455 TaxID=352165 RepID=A0ABM9ZU10_9BACT|nr:hypothetical protein HMPREF7215_2250 [Pyramidobacter piscolens W5455]
MTQNEQYINVSKFKHATNWKNVSDGTRLPCGENVSPLYN